MLKTNPTPDTPRGLSQNTQSGAPTSSEEKLKTPPLDQHRLPGTPIPPESLDEAKNLLTKRHSGIAYADVLKSVSEKSWSLSEYPHKDSLDLTRKLVELHPQLAREHQTLASSEGFVAYALALIPFARRPLASLEFLKVNKGINQIVEELENGGLVRVSHFVNPSSGLYARMAGVSSISRSFFLLSPTDFGVLALSTH